MYLYDSTQKTRKYKNGFKILTIKYKKKLKYLNIIFFLRYPIF